MHNLALFHKSKRTRIFLECNKILVLKKQGNLAEINSIENVWNIMKKEIDNQLLCLIEDM